MNEGVYKGHLHVRDLKKTKKRERRMDCNMTFTGSAAWPAPEATSIGEQPGERHFFVLFGHCPPQPILSLGLRHLVFETSNGVQGGGQKF